MLWETPPIQMEKDSRLRGYFQQHREKAESVNVQPFC